MTNLLPVLQPVPQGKARWWQLERGRLTCQVCGRRVIRGRVEEPRRADGEWRGREDAGFFDNQPPRAGVGDLGETVWQLPSALMSSPRLRMDAAVLGSQGEHLEGVVGVPLPRSRKRKSGEAIRACIFLKCFQIFTFW